jgi:hypothetical protein
MSRNLPARPNLEYLKNEAKDRLGDLRQADPDAQLSEAQHALARDYGFASWPALKAHVESLTAAARNAIAGGWIANLAQSKRHPSNQVRGTTVEIVDEFVDESGKAVRGQNTVEADGVEREGRNGYTIRATLGSRGLQTVATKEGQVIGRSTYSVSPDGRTLTIEDDSGESVIVLDRLIQ